MLTFSPWEESDGKLVDVGGGDPCGVAELCKSAPSDQKKQARTDIFSKYLCHVHKVCLEAKNGTKN